MSTQQEPLPAKIRVHHFGQLKASGQKFSVVTAYDYPTGLAADASGAEAILVGDSLGMVALGLDTTLPVSLDVMVHHTAAVRRGAKRAFVIADMPFLSYGVSMKDSILHAGRLMQEGSAEAVKIEGGVAMAETIAAICNVGIPVLAHIGLLPQSVHKLGGHRVQGKTDEAAEQLMRDALAVQEAGAFGVVLEAMPAEVARRISEALTIPTIGIGAGAHCDGQVLVLSDLVGMLPGRVPKFVKQYANVADVMKDAISRFATDVREGKFPSEDHQY